MYLYDVMMMLLFRRLAVMYFAGTVCYLLCLYILIYYCHYHISARVYWIVRLNVFYTVTCRPQLTWHFFFQAEEEARKKEEEERERKRIEEEQRQAALVKVKALEDARRAEEEAKRLAEEERRRQVNSFWFLSVGVTFLIIKLY